MSRSVLTGDQHAQMHALREWARKQGKTPTGISNAERQSLAQVTHVWPDASPDNPLNQSPAPDPNAESDPQP